MSQRKPKVGDRVLYYCHEHEINNSAKIIPGVVVQVFDGSYYANLNAFRPFASPLQLGSTKEGDNPGQFKFQDPE